MDLPEGGGGGPTENRGWVGEGHQDLELVQRLWHLDVPKRERGGGGGFLLQGLHDPPLSLLLLSSPIHSHTGTWQGTAFSLQAREMLEEATGRCLCSRV